MPGKSNGAVAGYKYYMGMHMVLCQKADALLGIIVGDRILWGWDNSSTGATAGALGANWSASMTPPSSPTVAGPATTNAGFTTVGVGSTDLYIIQTELFGGDTREGGISGTVGVRMGEDTQVADPYLQRFFGAYTPAFRGVVSIILKEVYIGVNPYLKNWSFLLRRTSCANWQPTYAKIKAPDNHFDTNPAHMIRECITDTDFGMGQPLYKIDDASFSNAAITLYNEGFGVSFIWDQQSPVEDFLQMILNHINGVVSVSLTTGLFELKLLRADYTVSSLPIFDESNIVKVDNFQRAAWGETVNEVVVQYTSRFTGKPQAVTVQDLANMQVQGGLISVTHKFPGITNADLAARVAQRDLQTLSTPLSKVKFTVNRTAWNLGGGDVFRFSWSKLGIASMVFRVGQVSFGTLLDGTITVEAVEDVFALPAVSYINSGDTPIETPPMSPVPAVYQRLVEASFWDLVMRIGTNQALAQASTAAWVLGAAAKPASTAASYQFETSGVGASGPFDATSTGYFSPTCALPALAQEVVSTVTYSEQTNMKSITVGDYGYVGDEAVSVAAINLDTHQITLNRGVLDTVPVAHAADRLYITSKLRATSSWEYVEGELVHANILPQFPLGTLDRSQATSISMTLAGRPSKPYPPGNLKLNGSSFPAQLSKSADLVITWAHRSRPQQTAYIVLQTESNIGPETGVTYTLRISNSILGLLLELTGLTGVTHTLTAAEFAAVVANSAYRYKLLHR